jgi:hypothetical protein
MNYDIVSQLNTVENYGKVIYLLGSAESGPVQTPVKVRTTEVLKDVFGSLGTIVEAFNQITDVAGSNCEIYCVKVTGTHATLTMDVNVKGQNVINDGFIMKSKYANEIYNNIYVALDNQGMTFYFPTELGGGTRRYTFSDYEILGLLIRAINEDTKKGLNHVWVHATIGHGTPLDGLLFSVNPSMMNFSGGNSGLYYSKDQYWFCLCDTYDLLESEYIDIILPLDAFMDDVHPRFYYGDQFESSVTYSSDRDYLDLEDSDGRPITFHRPLIDFCKKQMRFGLITHGIMGFNKIPDIEELNNQAYNYIDVIKGSPLGDRIGFLKAPETDDGFFISVVAGELEYSDGTIANGYTGYAGLMASTTIASSLTNKPLGDKVKLATTFTSEQLEAMANLGVVSFRDSILKGLVVSNAVTPVADISNELHYSCNVRMIQLTLSFIKLQLDKFLGEDINKLIDDNAIDTTIKGVLEYLKEQDVLKDYTYTQNIDRINGVLQITLDLKTLYMVESCSVSAEATFKV